MSQCFQNAHVGVRVGRNAPLPHLVEGSQSATRFFGVGEASDKVPVAHCIGLDPRLGRSHQPENVLCLSEVVGLCILLQELVVHFDSWCYSHGWEGL